MRMTDPDAAPVAAADPPRTRGRRIAKWVAGGLAATVLTAGAVAVTRIATYADPGHAAVARAGYRHKFAEVNGVRLSYMEGPDSGPPLVLLHAQLLDWFSYNRAMPALAKHFHVFAVDYPGHGQTRTPPGYPMDANRIGSDLAAFIQSTIGAPAFVTGNSSGGLLTLWLAANRPDLVRGALLEDPPLFASEYPAIKGTTAYRAFRTSKRAQTDHPKDFLIYWIDGNAGFFNRNIGPGAPQLLKAAVRTFRFFRPGEPVELGLPNRTAAMILRGLGSYDPRFGAAFYDGTWNKGFDHAQALARVRVPTVLMHANWELLPDGTLSGAMTDEQASRAEALLKTGTLVRVDSSHVVNLERPEVFTAELIRFADRVEAGAR